MPSNAYRLLCRRPIALAVALLGVLPTHGWGQSAGDDNTTVSVNYVYAAQLGIGSYDIGGLSVHVFTLPLAITRPLGDVVGPDLPLDDAQGWRVRFKLPVSFGVFDFEVDDPEFGKIDIDQYTLAVVPGVEFQVPINEFWTLKPFGDLGLGKVIVSEGEGAGDEDFFLVYNGGLRSLIEIPYKDYTFSLGNGVLFPGNHVFGEGDDESYVAIETGVEVRRGLGFTLREIGITDPAHADVTPELGLYFIHYHFPDPLVFTRFRDEPLRVDNQFEFGATLGSATPWELLRISNPRLGASYIFGDDLEVFRVSFGFPF